MNIAQASLEKRVVTWVMTAVVLVGGMVAYNKLGRLEDPEFTLKTAKVYTSYPGATALEVADEVTDKVETAIQQMGQLDCVKSISRPGFSDITVEIRNTYSGKELPQVWDELRRKVADIQAQLPPGAGPSVVYDDFGDVYGVFYAVYGDGYTYAELRDYAKLLRRELLLCQDVAKISLFGMQNEVVYIEFSRARLAQLGISPEQIAGSLQARNAVADSGRIEVDSKFVRIHPTGELHAVEDLGETMILAGDGSAAKIRLKDIATVRRGYQDPPDMLMRFNGKPAIGIGISTVKGGNVVTMGAAVDRRLEELRGETPIGMEVAVVSHQSKAVVAAIDGFVVSLIEAVAIVIGVLLLTMGMRSAVVIGLVLILTVLGTFIPMLLAGVMLERISLGALIIALGMLVDNAIVVVEGILVGAQSGKSREEAGIGIVRQTVWPLLGATVVAILAFAAIGASKDSSGEYCRSLFLVILYSLFLSWVLAVTVTPVLGAKLLKPPKADGSANKDPYGGLVFRSYRRFLERCIRHRWLTVAILVGLLLASVVGFGQVKKSFFPDSTRPQFMVHFWMPQGTHIRATEESLAKLAEFTRSVDGVADVVSFAGGGALRFLLTYAAEESNPAYGLLLVGVDDHRQIDRIGRELDQHVAGHFPDAMSFVRRFALGPGDPSKIQARFRGPDPAMVRRLADQAADILHGFPEITGVYHDWRDRVPLVRPLVAASQMRNAGVTRPDVANALLAASEGQKVGLFREGEDLLPIVARAVDSERRNIADLMYTRVWSPVAQAYIPISQVVLGFQTGTEDTLIRRRDRLPTITVKCDPVSGPPSAAFAVIRPAVEALPLPPGYDFAWGGEYEDSSKAQAALMGKIPVVFAMMVLIVVILFNSLRQPAVIFLTMPLALIGVTVGLLASGQPFGFMALLGFLSLSGMLIKNAIVLIDEINAQLAAGKDGFAAIVESGLSRARPVALAAATTVLGMIPLLADAFFVSMAVTIMFGLTFATVLTLVVVPVLYAIFFRIPNPQGEA